MARSSTANRFMYGTDEPPTVNFGFRIIACVDEMYEIQQIENLRGRDGMDDSVIEGMKEEFTHASCPTDMNELCADKDDKVIYAEHRKDAHDMAEKLEEKWRGKKFMDEKLRYIVCQVKVDEMLERNLHNRTKIESLSDLENTINNFTFLSNETEIDR